MNDPRQAVGGLLRGVRPSLGKRFDAWAGSLRLRGLCAVGLGVCALVWPAPSLALLTRLVGVYAVADGLAGVVGALRGADREASLAQSLVAFGVGGVLLLWPGMTNEALLGLLGATLLVFGVGQWLAARGDGAGSEPAARAAESEGRRVLQAAGGALGVAGLALLLWPAAGVVAVSWLLSAVAFLVGALLLYVARRLGQIGRRLEASGPGARQTDAT